MKKISLIIITTLALSSSAFGAANAPKGTKNKTKDSTLSLNHQNNRRLAVNSDSNTNYSGQTTKESRRFITDGGNPTPGDVLISPMIGQYALLGLEVGAKVSFRVDDHGFIPAINNSISLEGGVFRGTWFGIFGKNESMFYSGTGRWDFHLAPKWTVYGAAGLILEQFLTKADYKQDGFDQYPTIQIGGMMNLSRQFRLRAEYDTIKSDLRFGCVCAL